MTSPSGTDHLPEGHLGQARRFVIVGGGPAGLTAAYELVKLGYCPIVIEKRNMVGGIARTENYNGYYFDMGGHRFFTKAPEVNQMWRDVLGPEFLRRPRLSRIYYRKRFFYYPLKPLNALRELGPLEGVLNVLSYARWQLKPCPREETFEEWVTNRFGQRLFNTFFKTYTEKVWGISTSELSAEWAAQRIKNLSLGSALTSMFIKPQGKITSLIEEFDYPRRGPGMMWQAVQAKVESHGGRVLLNAEAVRIYRTGSRITGVVVAQDGKEELIEGTDFISSMAIKEFVERVESPPPAVLEAVQSLHYRAFLTVCLIVDKPDLFPDNWIYIHDPEVRVGRIQNFKNWSPDMVPHPSKTSLGLEYFCDEGDELWSMPDGDLVELGTRELEQMGLARSADVVDGCVFRVEKAYPVYDSSYRDHLAHARRFVESLDNLATIGRNGLHRYNNQDHAMLTGMLAVRNLLFEEQHDLWRINAEDDYHEEVRDVQASEIVEDALQRAFPRLDSTAFGTAVGLASGAMLFLMTMILVLKGGPVVGPTLGLLSQFFPFYDVTPIGSLLGLFYGFVFGFLGGWGVAALRNLIFVLSLEAIGRRQRLQLLWKALY